MLSPEVTHLSKDSVWPFLLAKRAPAQHFAKWDELIPIALKNGKAAAELVRRRYPGLLPSEIVEALGIPVRHSSEQSNNRWVRLRAEYQMRPLRITIYRSAIDSLTCVAQQHLIYELNSSEMMFEVMLAHELYHHFEPQLLPNSRRQYRTLWFRFGAWEIYRPLNVLHEIAAHSFVRQLCNLNVSPAVLDLLEEGSTGFQVSSILNQARINTAVVQKNANR